MFGFFKIDIIKKQNVKNWYTFVFLQIKQNIWKRNQV